MVRKFEELNKLEKTGLNTLLMADGWTICSLGVEGIKSFTKKIGEKYITICEKDFWVDND